MTDCATADLVAYLREFHDDWHQAAAVRLEAYERVIVAALRRGEDCGDDLGTRGGISSLRGVDTSGAAINVPAVIEAGDYGDAASSLPPHIVPAPRD